MKLIALKIGFLILIVPMAVDACQSSAAAKTKAEEEEMQELADQFLEEFYPTPEQIIAKDKKLKAAEAKKIEEEQLARARAELEASITRQRLQEFMNKAFLSFKDETPLALAYLCSKTLQELYGIIDRIETGKESIELSRQYGVGLNHFAELQAKIRNMFIKELDKRRTNNPSSFKSLILLGLRPPLNLNFLTYIELQNAMKAIDLLEADSSQQECWMIELSLSKEQLKSALNRLKSAMNEDIKLVNERVQQDLKKEAEEKKQELSESALMREAAKRQKVQEDIKKLKELENKFPDFFKNIPAGLQLRFLNEYETLYAQYEPIEIILEKLYKDEKSRILSQRLIALGYVLDLPAYAQAGYVYFTNGPQIDRNIITLPKYIDIQGKLGWEHDPQRRKNLEKEIAEAAQNLVDTYKIHLMPADSLDQIEVLLQISKALKSNPDLSKEITKFKLVYYPYQQKDELTGQPIVFPKVVIYAFSKNNAQKILNEVYESLKNMPGLNIRPRGNAKVTDLIWIAQGDGDYKTDRYTAYYENPLAQNGRVYYRKDITGKDQNYHLKHPHPAMPNKDIE